MSRPSRGVAFLTMLAVVAGLGAVLLREGTRSTAATTSATRPVRLDPLPPYEKPPVPDGFRAERVSGLWRLERIEADSRTLVIRAASGGCWKFDFMSLDGTSPGSIHLTAWNEAWRPTRENYGCTLELSIGSYRVRLPQPLAGRRIDGECLPGDSSPRERQCAILSTVAGRS